MKNFIFIFILTVIIGCEPGYRIYVRNTSSTTVYLKTHPSIESLCLKQSSYYDSIIINKVKEEGDFSFYAIKPLNSFRVWGSIGGKPTLKEIPFDYVAIIRGSDTLILDNKEKIINQIKREGKKFDYYIEIEK